MDNQCTEWSIDHESDATRLTTRIPDASVHVAIGTQRVQKFNASHYDTVRVHLAVIRLHSHATDILVSLNHPLSSSEGQEVDQQQINHENEAWSTFVTTLVLRDPGLFA